MARSDAGTVTNLIVRIRNGDADAIHELFPKVMLQLADKAERILRRFPRFAYDLTPDELVNETYERVAQQLAGRDIANRHHFIAIACKHFWWELCERARRPGIVAGPLAKAQEPNADDVIITDLEEEELILFAYEAVDQMDDYFQRIIYLKYWCDATVREIAEELNLSRSKVQRDLNQAIKEVRARFRQDLSYE